MYCRLWRHISKKASLHQIKCSVKSYVQHIFINFISEFRGCGGWKVNIFHYNFDGDCRKVYNNITSKISLYLIFSEKTLKLLCSCAFFLHNIQYSVLYFFLLSCNNNDMHGNQFGLPYIFLLLLYFHWCENVHSKLYDAIEE